MTQEKIKVIEQYLNENIKWEQRRYEIAKDCLAAMVASDNSPFVSKTQIGTCVQLANELISVLIRSKVSYGHLDLNELEEL